MNFLDNIYDLLIDDKNINTIKVRTFTKKIPKDLQYIYDICTHEIKISESAVLMQFYCDVYFHCLLNYYLINKFELGVNTIVYANKYLRKSSSKNEALTNYQELSDNHHELYISILNMKLYDMKFQKLDQDVLSVLRTLVFSKMLNIPTNISKDILKEKFIILK